MTFRELTENNITEVSKSPKEYQRILIQISKNIEKAKSLIIKNTDATEKSKGMNLLDNTVKLIGTL